MYVDAVQAALCHKLGANATVANLPGAMLMLGALSPLLLSLIVPHRLDRAVLVVAKAASAVSIGLVFLTLILPLPPWIVITAVITQGLLHGFANSTANVFNYQCLARGTTAEGRARAFKYTFSLGPILAVAGSLGTQYVLNHGFSSLPFPYDFALLYAIATFAITGVSILSSRYQMIPMADEPRPPIVQYFGASLRQFFGSRSLLLLFLVYVLWHCAHSATVNLSLFASHATHKEPKEMVGYMMAIRFGCKAAAGYLLGVIALRAGIRASVIAASLFFLLGLSWGWAVPGYAFLLAFGFMGAGELGGAYIPNCGLGLSRPQDSARNLSILAMATAVASFAPTLHGALADRYGFPASFAFGILMACGAIGLTLLIRKPPAT